MTEVVPCVKHTWYLKQPSCPWCRIETLEAERKRSKRNATRSSPTRTIARQTAVQQEAAHDQKLKELRAAAEPLLMRQELQFEELRYAFAGIPMPEPAPDPTKLTVEILSRLLAATRTLGRAIEATAAEMRNPSPAFHFVKEALAILEGIAPHGINEEPKR